MPSTEWIGTDTDGAKYRNWSDGLPETATTNATFSGTSILSLVTGFGAIQAKGTLTASTISIGDTVTIGAKAYLYVVSGASADGEINIGADTTSSLLRLLKAINLSGIVGVDYGASMTIHPTSVAISSVATNLVAGFASGGAAGNSEVTTETGAAMAWGSGTMTGGVDDGALMNNIYINPEYPGSIHTPGTKPLLNANIVHHRGSGQVNFDVVNCNRIIVNSPNRNLAADLIMTSSLLNLEILAGRTKLHAPAGTALPDKIWVADLMGIALRSENLVVTGDAAITGAQLIVAPGTVKVDGPKWTAVDVSAGVLTIENGIVTTLRSTGEVILKSLDTMGTAFIMGGDLDVRQGPGGKTINDVWLAPHARFNGDEEIDTFTLHEIGRR